MSNLFNAQDISRANETQKTIVLNTPTDIELRPGKFIKVTLLDVSTAAPTRMRELRMKANHCPGAVMFLIEDENKAILYTGDIRCTWNLGKLPLLRL